MLESNTFRTMMLISGVMAGALLLSFLFVAPMVELDEQSKLNYQNVMNVTLDEDTTHLTAYDAAWFMVKAKARGNVSHY